MRMRNSRVAMIAAVTATVLAVAGCTSGAASGSSASGTVAVNVGNGMVVHLTKKPLRLAVFASDVVTDYGHARAAQAKVTADKLGMKMTLFDADGDPAKQLGQMQTALQSGKFDAAVVAPTDGSVVCKIITQQFPKANILVSANITPLCNYGQTQKVGKPGSQIWAPGTLNTVGSNNYIGYINAWFAAAAKANPGQQHVVVTLGPATAAQTRVVLVAEKQFEKDNPKYTVDTLYGDYSATTAFNEAQVYLQGHPDTTLMMSDYTPAISQGDLKAISAEGMQSQVHVVDQGFGTFSLDAIKAGTIQLSTLFFPANAMKLSIESLANAQKGKPGPRFVDDSVVGTAYKPFIVTKSTLAKVPVSVR